jgi:hypothetical protein
LAAGDRHPGCVPQSQRFLFYANEAVLPFYALHQTVLLTVGFIVVRQSIPDLLKWAIIALGSFFACLALYELLIRRFNVLRVLFGLRPSLKPCRHSQIRTKTIVV